jgi:isoleucyl-tRNA synthetase
VPLDLKKTINLPQTAFPMKANLPQNEPKMLERWEQMGLYERIREARKDSPKGRYILHDGPPYTSGPIHLGTAMNKCLKDFIVKSKTMSGFDAPYVPGWDCHGLPIEIKVDKELGGKKLQMKATDVRAACRKYAQKFLDLQRTQFKRIGVFGRFDRPYATMNPQYEAVVLSTFFSFYENGFVYKGLRAVYWCMHDETALAEAEVEYENHTSPTVWVKYALLDDPAKIDPALAGKTISTIIWTTTPWTLPASLAVAFHPDEEYVALESGDEVYIVASKLAADVTAKCGLKDTRELAHFPGRKMERLNFQHPFLDRTILGVLADYVTMDTGAGVVHTAPSHGAEDFATGVKYGLDATSNVDERGILRNGLPEYDGQYVFKANPIIIELLRKRGALLHAETTEHSYPHCWRCHNPVIFRATEQWFISMETPMPGGKGKQDTLRTRTLEEIKKVKWDPAWGEERLSNMIETRPDWCISRQRVWGVPIAVFLCESCGKPLNDHAINQKVVELFRKSGADAWFTNEPDSILKSGFKCDCGGTKFEKETDIFDVWLESGASYLALIDDEPDYPWPSDLYLEGGDQYRGWFQSSLLCAMGTHATPPYKGVVTPGWTLDEKGQAMSKSRGNDVDPVDIAGRIGGEIVRLWTASVDFREDVVGSETLMQRVAENYRAIRNNLFKNALGNLYDFYPQHALAFEKLDPLDQYMLRQTWALVRDVRKWYDEFAFHKIYHRVNHFCVVDLSAFYFDVIKDRLYTYAPNSAGRRSAQTAVWRIVEAMTRLLAPILTFTCEEVWQHLPKTPGRTDSVHLAKFPDAADVVGNAQVAEEDAQQAQDWTTLLTVREQVMKALEEERNSKRIGKSLEAQLFIMAADPAYSVLKRYAGELRYLFIVSAVTLAQGSGNGTGGGHVEVKIADGAKCDRCWNYSTHVGEDKTYPTVCERCSAVLKEIDPVTINPGTTE